MLLEPATVEEIVDSVLNTRAALVHRDGPRAWEFQPGCDGAHTGTAVMSGDWLSLRVPVSGRRSPRCLGREFLCGLMHSTGELPAGVKYVLEGTTPGMAVAFDLWLPRESSSVTEAEPGFEERIGDGLSGIERAFTLLKGTDSRSVGGETSGSSSRGTEPAADGEAQADQEQTTNAASGFWQKLVETAGWPYTARASGRIGVPLETSSEHVQAVLEPLVGVGARLSFECPAEGVTTEIGAHALAVMLLTVAGSVRAARPIAEPDAADGPTHIGWEVLLPSESNEIEMQQALSVLSIAAGMTARESRLFAEKSVARSYLEIRGWSP